MGYVPRRLRLRRVDEAGKVAILVMQRIAMAEIGPANGLTGVEFSAVEYHPRPMPEGVEITDAMREAYGVIPVDDDGPQSYLPRI